MSEIIMTNKELIAKALHVARVVKTIYMYAAYGFQVTDSTIARKAEQNLNGWYTPSRIATLKAVANQTPPTWGFDCVNLYKALLWGWTGDESLEKGGAKYAVNGVPDTNADGMFARCYDKTDDFTHIIPGEALWMSGHFGLYVGSGLAVECTPKWSNGVQVTAVHNIGKIEGYNGRKWTQHGKLPKNWILYLDEADMPIEQPEEEPIPEDALGRRLLKRGCSGEDVRELQRLLIQLGVSCGPDGADGIFGKDTEAAVKSFQTLSGLEVDGQFGKLSLAALKEALARQPEEPEAAEPAQTYTVTIHGLDELTAAYLLESYVGAEAQAE